MKNYRVLSIAPWALLTLISACSQDPGDDAPTEGSGGATGGQVSSTGGISSVGGNPLPGAGGTVNGGSAGEFSSGGGENSGGAPDGDGGETSSGGSGTGGEISSGGSGTGGEDPGEGTGGQPPVNCAPHTPANTPVGYGRQTTGGGNRAPVVVSSFQALKDALAAYRSAYKNGSQTSLVLHYNGSFNFASITDVCAQHTKDAQIAEIKEMENVTILGLAGSKANFGLKINRAKNVIVRNMVFGLLPGGGDSDAITIEGNGTNGDVENVWIDHNEFFSSTKDDCPGAGDTEFDGLVDIKKGARYITISYNYFHDHQKTSLLGASDSDTTDRYVTFHHNRYEKLVSRTPLQRAGYTHMFNNYYGQISSSAINVRMGGVALIESNYFEQAANPVTSRYSPEAGYWDLRNNFVGQGITFNTEADTIANADTWQTTRAFPANQLNYTYTAEPAACVKASVLAHAGARL